MSEPAVLWVLPVILVLGVLVELWYMNRDVLPWPRRWRPRCQCSDCSPPEPAP